MIGMIIGVSSGDFDRFDVSRTGLGTTFLWYRVRFGDNLVANSLQLRMGTRFCAARFVV